MQVNLTHTHVPLFQVHVTHSSVPRGGSPLYHIRFSSGVCSLRCCPSLNSGGGTFGFWVVSGFVFFDLHYRVGLWKENDNNGGAHVPCSHARFCFVRLRPNARVPPPRLLALTLLYNVTIVRLILKLSPFHGNPLTCGIPVKMPASSSNH